MWNIYVSKSGARSVKMAVTAFHAVDRGSNPPGDAKFKGWCNWRVPNYVPITFFTGSKGSTFEPFLFSKTWSSLSGCSHKICGYICRHQNDLQRLLSTWITICNFHIFIHGCSCRPKQFHGAENALEQYLHPRREAYGQVQKVFWRRPVSICAVKRQQDLAQSMHYYFNYVKLFNKIFIIIYDTPVLPHKILDE